METSSMIAGQAGIGRRGVNARHVMPAALVEILEAVMIQGRVMPAEDGVDATIWRKGQCSATVVVLALPAHRTALENRSLFVVYQAPVVLPLDVDPGAEQPFGQAQYLATHGITGTAVAALFAQ
jgi:hypothetical protein